MMVRRRKQLKPSGAQRGVVKATLISLDTGSPLVNLPAEIQGIITSYVRHPLIDAIHWNGTTVLMRLG